MRQVPCYLIIGHGRLARHMLHYFSLLQLRHLHWYRGQSLDLLTNLQKEASHILVLISDDAIEPFIREYLSSAIPSQNTSLSKPYIIHCSGSLNTELAFGVHPLMTFGDELYDIQHYQSFPLIIDDHAPSENELLPDITNPVLRINPERKAYYHALCVLSGNFSCLLWQKMINEFNHQFNWPKEYVFPYLQQQTLNLIKNSDKALTGPLVRGDTATINKNLSSLQADPFAEVYQSFVNAYESMRSQKNDN